MNIAELRAREELDDIVCETLATSLGPFCGADTGAITPADRGAGGQMWRAHVRLSAYCTDDLYRAGRRFLADQFRYTPVRWRVPAQWALGTVLSTRVGLALAGEPGFTVERPIPRPGRFLVVPGNRRLRLFDFERGTTRTVVKAGFDDEPIRVELAVRAERDAGPFTAITSADQHHRWFEEPILIGYPLPRCPPWRRRERWEARAMQRLARWLDDTGRDEPRDAYVTRLSSSVRARLHTLDAAHDMTPALLARVADRASRGEPVVHLARTHGDFQPGNIFIDTRHDEVVLIDWEYSKHRQRAYDGLVYELASRFPTGLGARLARFVDRGDTSRAHPILTGCDSPGRRGDLVALFVLEELDWYLQPAAARQRDVLPSGFLQFCREVTSVIECM